MEYCLRAAACNAALVQRRNTCIAATVESQKTVKRKGKIGRPISVSGVSGKLVKRSELIRYRASEPS